MPSLSPYRSNMADALDDEWWLDEKDVEDTGKFCFLNYPTCFRNKRISFHALILYFVSRE